MSPASSDTRADGGVPLPVAASAGESPSATVPASSVLPASPTTPALPGAPGSPTTAALPGAPATPGSSTAPAAPPEEIAAPERMPGRDDSGADGGGDDADAEDGDGGDDGDPDGGDPDDGDDGDGEHSPARAGGISGVTLIRVALVGVLLVVAAVVVAFAVSGPATPGDNSVAAGLARDMIDHHAQGVDMASIVEGRTKNSDLRYLAEDIVLTQTNQMGQMQGWLNTWDLSLGRSGQPMQWMNQVTSGMNMTGSGSSNLPAMDPSYMHLRPDGLMPGMATQAQVNQLRTLPPDQADILFLQLMIAHHRGGVAMAQAALAGTKERVVVNLCKTIVTSQTAEIGQMTQMLQKLQKTS